MAKRIIRLPEVRRLVGLSARTIFRRERDGTFPASRRIGGNSIGWLITDIEEFIDSLPRNVASDREAS